MIRTTPSLYLLANTAPLHRFTSIKAVCHGDLAGDWTAWQ